jgi:hypothetical protein
MAQQCKAEDHERHQFSDHGFWVPVSNGKRFLHNGNGHQKLIIGTAKIMNTVIPLSQVICNP